MSEDKKPKKKKKAGDVFLTIVLIAAICVFCYAAYNLYHIYTEYKKGSDEYNAIAQMAVTERDPDQDSTSESEEAAGPGGPALKAPLDIDFDSLRSINTDVIGWIYVEALDGVSYPVRVSLMKDIVTVGIDTTGVSLHKRGYRKLQACSDV